LEGLIEKALQDFSAEAQQGAVFLDPDGRLDGLLWFLEGEVRDGEGRVAGRRLFALYQGDDRAIREVSPAILWDLKPASAPIDRAVNLAERVEEDEIMGLPATRLEKYLEEIRFRRRRDAKIKEKYGIRSLERLIAESEAKLLKLETRRAKGEAIPEPTLINERRRKEELLQKKSRLEQEIRAESHLLLSDPKVVGVFAVLPAPVSEELVETEEIERIGMEVALAYEGSAGRLPEDVSAEKVGYDIRSMMRDGSEMRYIEVKARSARGNIALTRNEWFTAQRLGDEYWLYIVVDAATEPTLHLVHNPAEHLRPEEEIEVVRYVVSQEQWQEVAQAPA